ncbi:hypothetical protein M9H77_22562 [Catharanthus roseus]|uniref:Uncharacterized protein n=1 Tax=Catharanthus roseus TaxID=4058 RepID=A0ACC0ASX7_CATRO|nr:hypothetical protein M9H77_22562 [Catharanthus roseus]
MVGDVNQLDVQEHQGVVTRAKAKQRKSHKDQIEQEKFQGLNYNVQDFMGQYAKIIPHQVYPTVADFVLKFSHVMTILKKLPSDTRKKLSAKGYFSHKMDTFFSTYCLFHQTSHHIEANDLRDAIDQYFQFRGTNKEMGLQS